MFIPKGSKVKFVSRASYAVWIVPLGGIFLISRGLVAARDALFPVPTENGSIRYYPRFQRRLRGLTFECVLLLQLMVVLLIANSISACVFFFSPVYDRFGGITCVPSRCSTARCVTHCADMCRRALCFASTVISILTNTKLIFATVRQWHMCACCVCTRACCCIWSV